MKISLKKFISLTVILTLAFLLYPIYPPVVNAGGLTYMKDTMSTLTVSNGTQILADHEIMFVTEHGVASGETIVITFPSDFLGDTEAVSVADIDMFVEGTPDHTCVDGVAQDLVATGATVSQWNVVLSGTDNRIVTFTSGGGSATVPAADEVCIKIGENASGGTLQYENPTSIGSKTIGFSAGSTPDTGDCLVNILTDDSVDVSGTVPESLTFAITGDFGFNFGTLYTSKDRWAGDADGSDTVVSAHDLEVTTNAATGYSVTYSGATLTNPGSQTIDVAEFTGAAGTFGTEQFAMSISKDGDATIETLYQYSATKYKFVAGAVTSIISENGSTAKETFGIYYICNISTTTHSGVYTTAITYVATANF